MRSLFRSWRPSWWRRPGLPGTAGCRDLHPRAAGGPLHLPARARRAARHAWTSLWANLIFLLVGTPAAYLLATTRFPGRALVLTLCELPLVLPPAVAGIGLLVAFGRTGILSGRSSSWTVDPFTQTAVILAVAFVAGPFYLRGAIAAFASLDRDCIEAARTLGARRAASSRGSRCRWPLEAWARRGPSHSPRRGGVRRHHHLRGLAAGQHPDPPAGRLRPVPVGLRRGAGHRRPAGALRRVGAVARQALAAWQTRSASGSRSPAAASA